MKIRYIIALCAAAVGLASCGNENSTVAPGESMQAKVCVVNNQLTSRASWDENLANFTWAEGDNVAFYAPGRVVSKLTYSQEQSALTGRLVTAAEDGTWYATFPAASEIEYPSYDLKQQSGTLADFSNKYDIMVGKCENIKAGTAPSEISVEHKMALLEVKNNLTSSVQLVGRKGEYVITGVSLNKENGELAASTQSYNKNGNNPYLCEIPANETRYVAVPSDITSLQDNKEDSKATTFNKNPLSLETGKKYQLAINGKAQNTTLLSGEFSVSATKKVKFTKGNLYWDGSAFKFEANQYDYPTSWDAKHVGHFYWSKTASVAYAQSYSDNTTISDNFFCGEDNKITVEGTEGLYALSSEEWRYLIKNRANASSLYKVGVTVAGKTNCLIIAPDGYTGTIAASYDATAWTTAEATGLVCLPAVGLRSGSSLLAGGSRAYYWTATPDDTAANGAYYMSFDKRSVNHTGIGSRELGSSLRLVK